MERGCKRAADDSVERKRHKVLTFYVHLSFVWSEANALGCTSGGAVSVGTR